ncbi:MAG: ABC transporter permease subunit [Treponema sp.]|nr:ABC transporter permease subunit [Treponema sp.]
MLNKMQAAIIKKDIYNITSNKRTMSALVVVPIMMVVVMPVIFISIILFTPEDSSDMTELLQILQYVKVESGDTRHQLILMILDYVIPMFFLLIPIMASSVMASSSFVGEKEKSTLETLLYCPLSLKEIFNAKISASFILSMIVSYSSFIIMIITVEAYLLIADKTLFTPNINWLTMMLLVSPAAALISINMIVRGSAKSQTSEEAQQSSLFLVMPVILLIIGQFTGIMMMGPHIFLILGAVLAVIAILTFKNSYNKFTYEKLLK